MKRSRGLRLLSRLAAGRLLWSYQAAGGSHLLFADSALEPEEAYTVAVNGEPYAVLQAN